MVRPMDNLERRLKEDAALIKTDLNPQLQGRIRASLEATDQESRSRKGKESPGISLWWASSLTGLGAAAVVIVWINQNGRVEAPQVVSAPTPADGSWSLQGGFPLNAQTAEWTAPLEEELENLQSDLEKAREAVEKDLRLSF